MNKVEKETFGEELADEIIEVSIYGAPEPDQVKKFLPWHRPRKQYVRKHQWCKEIQGLIKNSSPSDGPLRYLGLPGVDLLDIRHFHETVCAGYGFKLRFLGFVRGAQPNSKSQIELNISLSEVRELEGIDVMSNVIADDFALIANPNSIAFRTAERIGPFDIVNIDLCDGFAAHEPSGLRDSYYNAVNRLMALQARSKRPWLLLLTTRADSDNIHPDVLPKLVELYRNNLKMSKTFCEESKKHFDIDTIEQVADALGTHAGLLNVFVTSLCKWLFSIAVRQEPRVMAELRSVFGYRVNPKADGEDLVSLALKFTPTYEQQQDSAGLATGTLTSVTEAALATKAIGLVATRVNADFVLEADSTLYSAAVAETKELLSTARYDVNAYDEWLELSP